MSCTRMQIQQYTALWRETTALYEGWARKHSLSYCELLVLLSLAEVSEISQKDICAHWGLPKQTVNSVLKNFIARAWVTLCPAPNDRRNKVIRLTELGQPAIARIAQELVQLECTVWERLGAARGKALIENTERYNRLFQEAL